MENKRQKELEDKLRRLYGLEPYNVASNIVYGDGYFLKKIEDSYTEEEISRAKKSLGLKDI